MTFPDTLTTQGLSLWCFNIVATEDGTCGHGPFWNRGQFTPAFPPFHASPTTSTERSTNPKRIPLVGLEAPHAPPQHLILRALPLLAYRYQRFQVGCRVPVQCVCPDPPGVFLQAKFAFRHTRTPDRRAARPRAPRPVYRQAVSATPPSIAIEPPVLGGT